MVIETPRDTVIHYNRHKRSGHEIGIEFRSDNYHIDETIIREFNLDFKNNDYGIIKYTVYFPESFDSLPKIKEFIQNIIAVAPKISKRFKQLYSCIVCGKFDFDYIQMFGERGVCEVCRNQIIEDYLNEV